MIIRLSVLLCMALIQGTAWSATRCEDLFSPALDHHDRLLEAIASSSSTAALTDKFYGPENAKKIRDELATIRESYANLAIDPGIVAHLKDFVDFAKAQEKIHGQTEPNQMRDLYSKSLGDEIVFRALALKENEFNNAMKFGLSPRSLVEDHSPQKVAKILEAKTLSQQLEAHILQQTDLSLFLSVSSEEAISVAVANLFVKDARKLYLFKIKIPKLDLVSLNGGLQPARELFPGYKIIVHNDGHEKTLPMGPQLEKFVFLSIKPDQILSARSVVRSDFPALTAEFNGRTMEF